jgi:heme oxygenase
MWTLGISPSAGASGLAPYGHALREMWVAYADALDGFVRSSPGSADEVVDGARDTFARTIAWMREPAAAWSAAALA